MSKGSAPQAPDPYVSSGAQYQYGTKAAGYTTALNDVNTQGPTGSTQYKITGYDPTTGAPIRTQTTQLAPGQQSIFDKSQGLQSGMLGGAGSNFLGQVNGASGAGAPSINPVQYSVGGAGTANGNIDTSGVPGIVSGSDAYARGQSTALKGIMAGMDPALNNEREQLDASLRNGGAHPGDPAYDRAMAQLDASQAAQRAQGAGQAVDVGNRLQQTQYGESANTNQQLFDQRRAQQSAAQSAQGQNFSQFLNNAQLNNSAGQTALANYAQRIGIPLNALQAILGGSQVNAPQAQAAGTANVNAPDVMSAFNQKYQGALAGYNANVATSNADTGAAIGAIATIASAY